jgi:hypothetical protein
MLKRFARALGMFSTATATPCSRARASAPSAHRSSGLPGKGRLPLEAFLGALAKDGYAGAVCLELKPWPLGAPDPKAILERMRGALGFVRRGLSAARNRPVA